ncbi:MAG TPA: hypothetical protein VK200_16705, partial [Candidatus Limnocylindrales bacterium]|nr:hypothetical protein [Candidatus Limnocylindrales bacterium]
TFVYVIKNDSSAEQRPVKIGQRQGDLVVVDEGVKASEQVVVKGQRGVTPGGKVRIAQPAAMNNAASPTKSGGKP